MVKAIARQAVLWQTMQVSGGAGIYSERMEDLTLEQEDACEPGEAQTGAVSW